MNKTTVAPSAQYEHRPPQEGGPCMAFAAAVYISAQLGKEFVTKGVPSLAKEFFFTIRSAKQEAVKSVKIASSHIVNALQTGSELTAVVVEELFSTSKDAILTIQREISPTRNSLKANPWKITTHLILDPAQEIVKEGADILGQATKEAAHQLYNLTPFQPGFIQDTSREVALESAKEIGLYTKSLFKEIGSLSNPSLGTEIALGLCRSALKEAAKESASFGKAALKEGEKSLITSIKTSQNAIIVLFSTIEPVIREAPSYGPSLCKGVKKSSRPSQNFKSAMFLLKSLTRELAEEGSFFGKAALKGSADVIQKSSIISFQAVKLFSSDIRLIAGEVPSYTTSGLDEIKNFCTPSTSFIVVMASIDTMTQDSVKMSLSFGKAALIEGATFVFVSSENIYNAAALLGMDVALLAKEIPSYASSVLQEAERALELSPSSVTAIVACENTISEVAIEGASFGSSFLQESKKSIVLSSKSLYHGISLVGLGFTLIAQEGPSYTTGAIQEVGKSFEFSPSSVAILVACNRAGWEVAKESVSFGDAALQEGKKTALVSSEEIYNTAALFGSATMLIAKEASSYGKDATQETKRALQPSHQSLAAVTTCSDAVWELNKEGASFGKASLKESLKIVRATSNGLYHTIELVQLVSEPLIHELVDFSKDAALTAFRSTVFIANRSFVVIAEIYEPLPELAKESLDYPPAIKRDIYRLILKSSNSAKRVQDLVEVQIFVSELNSYAVPAVKAPPNFACSLAKETSPALHMAARGTFSIIKESIFTIEAAGEEVGKVARTTGKFALLGIEVAGEFSKDLSLEVLDYLSSLSKESVKTLFTASETAKNVLAPSWDASEALAREFTSYVASGAMEVPKSILNALHILGHDLFVRCVSEMISEAFSFTEASAKALTTEHFDTMQHLCDSSHIVYEPVHFVEECLHEGTSFPPAIMGEIEKGWRKCQEDYPSSIQHFVKEPLEMWWEIKKRALNARKERIEDYITSVKTRWSHFTESINRRQTY